MFCVVSRRSTYLHKGNSCVGKNDSTISLWVSLERILLRVTYQSRVPQTCAREGSLPRSPDFSPSFSDAFHADHFFPFSFRLEDLSLCDELEEQYPDHLPLYVAKLQFLDNSKVWIMYMFV